MSIRLDHLHTAPKKPRVTRAIVTTARPAWRVVNISPLERAARIALGVGAIVAGALLLTTAGSVLAVILEALLIAAGLDLLVTGALGHCPLYARLGRTPRSVGRTR